MTSCALQNQQRLIESLLNPECYPHAVKSVRVIETHISWLLLAGRYAYKIKKALDLGFMNASLLASRRQFCAEEIRLNSRLAPQIYLGAVAIGGSYTHPEWGAEPAIEYAVKMRRFASSKTLDRLIQRGKLLPGQIDLLAIQLAYFHSGLPPAAPELTVGNSNIVQTAMSQNFSQLAELMADVRANLCSAELAKLTHSGQQAFNALQQRIDARRAQGFVRECHGDLHLGNIAIIGNQPLPFDGIDFNITLRWIDVADELSFIFMELVNFRRADFAYRLLNAYLEHTGDYSGVELLNFYCSYRATVRAKVSAIRANQTHSKRMKKCCEYLQLANDFLRPTQPRLIIMHGLPGSGKTTFSQVALEHMGAIRLRSDVERKRLFGLSALQTSRAAPGQDIYSVDATQRTYAHLCATARGLLAAGRTVIVDAAFLKHDEREMFRKLAVELKAPFAIASMQADQATLRSRIVHRQTQANDASEADVQVLTKLQSAQEPLTPQERIGTVIIAGQQQPENLELAWHALEDLLGKQTRSAWGASKNSIFEARQGANKKLGRSICLICKE
jgi:hypothetical protein